MQNHSQNYEDNQEVYFNKIIESMGNPQIVAGKVKQFNDLITNKLQGQILTSTIILPEQPKQLKIYIPPKISEEPVNEQQMLRSVQAEKMKITEKMKELQRQQFQLKYNIRNKPERERIMYKSELTQEDKNKLKDLIKASKQYQRQIRHKNKEIKQMQLEKSLEHIRSIEKQREQKRLQRKSQVLSNMKSMELKSSQRKKSLQASNKIIQNIKSKRYVYEALLEKERMQEYQKQKQYQKALQEFKNKSKLDTRQIQEHQKKYDKSIQEMRQRSSKMLENQSNLHVKSYGQNYYRNVTKQRIQQQKMQQLAKLKKGQDMKQKIMKFQQEINQKYKPKISEKSKFSLPKSTSSSAKVLSNVEQRLKGVQYLQIAKKLKDIEKEKERRRTHAAPITKIQYKDYLKDLKYNQMQTVEHKFKGILRNGRSMSDYDTATEAVLLAQQIQAKSKKMKDQKLVSSVKHKLQILKALE